MSSIGNILHTLNTSLLSEIGTLNKAQPSTTAASTTSTSSASDSVGVSKFAQLMQQLQQLQTSNPAEFKTVMSDAATQLKAAAAQQTDPGKATFLNNLSDRFQKAADTGDLSALKPQGGIAGAYGHHGHHGHHHVEASTDTDPSSTASTGTTAATSAATTAPTDLASLLSQVLGSSQAGANGQPNAQSQSLIAGLFSAME
jgi:hypothetical protein